MDQSFEIRESFIYVSILPGYFSLNFPILRFYSTSNKTWHYPLVNFKGRVEDPGIDPGTSRMLSERSTIWASPPVKNDGFAV